MKWSNHYFIWLQKKLKHNCGNMVYSGHGSELNMIIQTNFFSTNLLMALSLWDDLIRSLVFNLCYSIWIALKIWHFWCLFSSSLGVLKRMLHQLHCIFLTSINSITSFYCISRYLSMLHDEKKNIKGMHLPFHSKMLPKSLFPSKVQIEKVRHSSDCHTGIFVRGL